MIAGIVEWFSDSKGYGFIRSPEMEGPLLVHYTSIQGSGHRTLSPGQRVYFQLGKGLNGPKAVNIYSEELYAERLSICDHNKPVSVHTLVKDCRFLQEVKRAFNQLPNQFTPTREWSIEQLLGFEPAKLSRGDVEAADLTALEEFVSDLQRSYLEQKAKAEHSISKLEMFEKQHTIDPQKCLSRKLRARLQSLGPIPNKQCAATTFENIAREADQFRHTPS